jgi:hypothetical protein
VPDEERMLRDHRPPSQRTGNVTPGEVRGTPVTALGSRC